MAGCEADALARELIESRGFGAAFGHSLGHAGLGLGSGRSAALSKTNPEPLPADAVVAIEPGVYLPGQGGVRIEDDVYLASDGPVLLSNGRTELTELVLNLDIIARLVQILRDAPELGAIEVRRVSSVPGRPCACPAPGTRQTPATMWW